MRASRLLHMLMLLQNRGRMPTSKLASELEVTQRTIMRDIQALGEAGLPILVTRGARGGVELAFSYRSRLTSLSSSETEALALVFAHAQAQPIVDIGLAADAARAVAKVTESFADLVRQRLAVASGRLKVSHSPKVPDPRIAALADAVRNRRRIRLRAFAADEIQVEPASLEYTSAGWVLQGMRLDALGRRTTVVVPAERWGHVNISGLTF